MKKSVRILNTACRAGCILFLVCSLALGVIAVAFDGKHLKNAAGNPDERESALDNALTEKSQLILAPSQMVNHLLNRRYFPENQIYINSDGQFLKGSTGTSTGDAAEKVGGLYQYCRESGRDFLYVIFPGKPLSDEDLRRSGIHCDRNAAADILRDELLEREIPLLDMRDSFQEDSYSIFYRTDHHWTADAGLKAAKEILNTLNREYGNRFDTQQLDPSRFERTVYPDFWVGEMGRKVQGEKGIRDDLVILNPLDPVRLRLYDMEKDEEVQGGFEILTVPELLEKYHPSVTPYYYYLSGLHLMEIENQDVEEGQVMMIFDSFSNVVLPFMSLAVGHLTAWDMRNSNRVYEYLEEHPEIQTVVIAYNIGFMPTSYMNDFQ